MTIYERYQAGETQLVQVDFVKSLFMAYEDADEQDAEILNKAFPQYFVEGSKFTMEDREMERHLHGLEELLNGKLYEDTVLKGLKEQRKRRIEAIAEIFITTEAADIPDEFVEHMIGVLESADDEDGLDPDDEVLLEYLDLLFNGDGGKNRG